MVSPHSGCHPSPQGAPAPAESLAWRDHPQLGLAPQPAVLRHRCLDPEPRILRGCTNGSDIVRQPSKNPLREHIVVVVARCILHGPLCVTAALIAMSPESWWAVMSVLIMAFKIPPRRSPRPICHGARRAAWRTSIPWENIRRRPGLGYGLLDPLGRSSDCLPTKAMLCL